MSSSYSLYEIDAFPTIQIGSNFSTTYQPPLLSGTDDPPKTVFTLQRTIDGLQIDVYRILYEYIDRRIGRTQGINFVEFTSVNNFPAYHHKTKRLLMIKAKKDLVHGAIKRISKNSSDVKVHDRIIILDSIRPQLESLKGAWWKVDNSDDVSAQALFGSNIDRDERFDRASSEGEMSFVTFIYQFMNEFFTVGISSDGNVVLYGDNLDESLELELVLDIKEKLINIAQVRQTP